MNSFRFSEARCQRALPMAFAAYKEGLQPHYLEGYHNAKVNRQMVSLFQSCHKNVFSWEWTVSNSNLNTPC